MDRRALARLILAGCLVLGAALPHFAAAEAALKITVIGNRYIETRTIQSHFHAGSDGRLSTAELDSALKALYATGLFQDVRLSHAGEQIVVKVVENPIVGRVAFEGNKKVKDD